MSRHFYSQGRAGRCWRVSPAVPPRSIVTLCPPNPASLAPAPIDVVAIASAATVRASALTKGAAIQFGSSLTPPLLLKKRCHEPWHSRIELSWPTHNAYFTKFGLLFARDMTHYAMTEIVGVLMGLEQPY